MAIKGNDVIQTFKAEDEYECAKKCRELSDCEGFLYAKEGFIYPSQVHDCFLRKDLKYIVPVYTYDKIVSGYRSCTTQYTKIDSKWKSPIKSSTYKAYHIFLETPDVLI